MSKSPPPSPSSAEPLSLDQCLARARRGDEEAARILVERYEPAVRRVVRLRLANLPMAAVLDSTDICQSVLASFFVRLNLGQYTIAKPEQLIGLLATMARSKLASQARRELAGRRDRRRVASRAADEHGIAASGGTPSRQLAARELLHEVDRRLSPEERRIAQLRAAGHDWADVADQCGGSAEALRKRLVRALDRVARELGLEDEL